MAGGTSCIARSHRCLMFAPPWVGIPSIAAHHSRNPSNILRIALRHLEHLGADFDELPARAHVSPPALVALRDRNLIARAPRIFRSAQHLPRHRQQRRVIVQPPARFAPELRLRLAHECKRFRSHLEPQHMLHDRLVRRIIRPVSRSASRDHPLDVSRNAPAGHGEPIGFRRRRCHARQLAHGRPRELSLPQRPAELGKLFERLGHAKLFAREAAVEAEQAMRVLRHARVAEPQRRGGAQRLQEPASEFPFEPRVIAREPHELVVGALPIAGTRVLCLFQTTRVLQTSHAGISQRIPTAIWISLETLLVNLRSVQRPALDYLLPLMHRIHGSSPGFFPVRSFALARGFLRPEQPRRRVRAARNELRIDPLVNGPPQRVLVPPIGIAECDGAARPTPLANRSRTKSIAAKIGRSTGDERTVSTSSGDKPRVTRVGKARSRDVAKSGWRDVGKVRSRDVEDVADRLQNKGTNAHARGLNQRPRRLAPAVLEAQQPTGHEGATSDNEGAAHSPSVDSAAPHAATPDDELEQALSPTNAARRDAQARHSRSAMPALRTHTSHLYRPFVSCRLLMPSRELADRAAACSLRACCGTVWVPPPNLHENSKPSVSNAETFSVGVLDGARRRR
jgi:hypothetical protein